MPKKNGSQIDPVFALLRKNSMLTEENIILAETAMPLPKANVQALRHGVCERKGRTVPSKITQNMIWIDCIDKVAKSQDKAAFAKLFTHFAPRIKSFLMKSGATEGMAEECAQEALVTVWHKAAMFDGTRANASTWIFTIARNKRIDALRKRNRPEPDELTWNVEAEPDAADILAIDQENQILAKAISELPVKQLELVQRAFYADLSHKEIAQETGIPLGTIKSRLRLALEKLRHELKREDG